jgi:hypothetical protein
VGHQKDFFHEGKEVKVAHPLLDQVGVTADAGDQDGYLVMGASHPSTPMRHPTCMVQVHIVRVLLFAYPCCLLCAHPNTLVVFLPPPPRIPALQVCLLQEAHRAGLLADTQVEGWHFEQHEGEVVFIPAGCPHQVRNLRACTKVGGVCVCVCGGGGGGGGAPPGGRPGGPGGAASACEEGSTRTGSQTLCNLRPGWWWQTSPSPSDLCHSPTCCCMLTSLRSLEPGLCAVHQRQTGPGSSTACLFGHLLITQLHTHVAACLVTRVAAPPPPSGYAHELKFLLLLGHRIVVGY